MTRVDCCGFIISKLETYDARYFTSYTGAYERITATGGRAILTKIRSWWSAGAIRCRSRNSSTKWSMPISRPCTASMPAAIGASENRTKSKFA